MSTAAGPRGNTLGQGEGERDRTRVAARWTDASLMIDASRAPCCENGTAAAPRSHHELLAQSKQKRPTERRDKCSVLVYLARADDGGGTLPYLCHPQVHGKSGNRIRAIPSWIENPTLAAMPVS